MILSQLDALFYEVPESVGKWGFLGQTAQSAGNIPYLIHIFYYDLKYPQGLDGGMSPTQETCENMILLLEIVDIQAIDEVADDVDGIT